MEQRKKRAFLKLESILNNMKYGEIHEVKKRRDIFEVRLKNDDVYIALEASEHVRGHRCHYAYIDRLINGETFKNIICPTLINDAKSIENNYETF